MAMIGAGCGVGDISSKIVPDDETANAVPIRWWSAAKGCNLQSGGELCKISGAGCRVLGAG
jgi:hypothetical protein